MPVANLSIENATADEATLTSGVINVTLDHSFGVETTVKLSVKGTAKRGREYVISETSVVFGPDDVSKSVTITPLDDGQAKGDRTVVVKLAHRRGYQVGEAASATVTVVDKEPKVAITTTDSQAAETILGQAADTGSYHIVQSGTAPLDVAFNLCNSAKIGRDYLLYSDGVELAGRTVTVPPGPDGVDITLVPIDDTVVEPCRSAVLKLLSNVCYSLPAIAADRSAKVTIADNDVSTKFTIQSSSFKNGDHISGSDFNLHSPTFTWENVPGGTQSFAMIVETPCPVFQPFVGWVVYDIPGDATSLRSDDLPSGAKQGINSLGTAMWLPSLAPPGTMHTYYYQLYALDADLSLPSGLTRASLLSAMSGHVLGTATIKTYCGEGIPVYNDIWSTIKSFF
jgi:hypothetical protein